MRYHRDHVGKLMREVGVLPRSEEAWIYIAMIRIMLRRLAQIAPEAFAHSLSYSITIEEWSSRCNRNQQIKPLAPIRSKRFLAIL